MTPLCTRSTFAQKLNHAPIDLASPDPGQTAAATVAVTFPTAPAVLRNSTSLRYDRRQTEPEHRHLPQTLTGGSVDSVAIGGSLRTRGDDVVTFEVKEGGSIAEMTVGGAIEALGDASTATAIEGNIP